MDQQKLNVRNLTPQALDLEEGVLGAMLIDEKSILEVAEFLNSDIFYKEAHQHIYTAIRQLFIDDLPIDIITVLKQLRNNKTLDKAGGEYYIIQLTQKVSTSGHIEYHSRILLQKYAERRLIKNCQSIINNCYKEENDVFDLLETAYSNLNEVSEGIFKSQETLFIDLVQSGIDKGRDIYDGKIKPGIETPIKKMTFRTGGFRNSELIVLAGRPGMGKTAFALLIAITAARNGIPVAFFSLEMSKEQLTNRIISMVAKIDGKKFTIDGLSPDDLLKIKIVRNELNSLPLYIDDSASLSVEEFQVKSKRLRAKNKIGLIVVDYLQLMTSKGFGREQEVSKISRGLKLTAKSINVPVIALSQLSRGVESRPDKRPILSDLRESGAIEQDADVVIFLYRPEYYKIQNWDQAYSNAPTAGQAEYIVAKNRNGGLARSRIKFDPNYTLFENLD